MLLRHLHLSPVLKEIFLCSRKYFFQGIVLIRKITTLKPVHLECLNFMHLVAFPQLRNAENLNLICLVVPELQTSKVYIEHII